MTEKIIIIIIIVLAIVVALIVHSIGSKNSKKSIFTIEVKTKGINAKIRSSQEK